MTIQPDITYSEVISAMGMKVPFVPEIITPKIERPLRNGRYVRVECERTADMLRSGDRMLELGAGLGLVSSYAAATGRADKITTVEANPELLPLIRETHRLNGLTNVDLRNGVVTAAPARDLPFYLRADFWASSMEPDSRPFRDEITVPALDIASLLSEVDPTVLVADIEGGELGLFDDADLSGVRDVIIELHPKVYGNDGVEAIYRTFRRKGLMPHPDNSDTNSVHVFQRVHIAPAFPGRARVAPDAPAPKVLIGTCMKDEGPFILEWLAWHKSIGVKDFVVFTNDCTDGTGKLLDHLQDMGELTHLPNPAMVSGSPAFQPIALKYLHYMRQMREADYFISMDVDEFITVKTGDGSLKALFDEVGAFDVLSMSELNHGCNKREGFAPGWVTEQFPAHQSSTPGKWKARRGVKSIVCLSDQVEGLRNHRPDMIGEVRWLDGSGRETDVLHIDRESNGMDCRRAQDLVVLDHFALRSLDSYLVKMFRGDVVVKKKKVSARYWRMRNRHDEALPHMEDRIVKARAWYAEHYEADARLMTLQRACEKAHVDRIKELRDIPEFAERRAWAKAEAWDQ